jgi:fimbrial chaperone protein
MSQTACGDKLPACRLTDPKRSMKTRSRQTNCGEYILMSFRHIIGTNKELKTKNKWFFFIIFYFFFMPTLSMAGSFTVSPVKLHLDSKASTTVIRITNNNDERVTVQLDAKEWVQNEIGSDAYKQTKNFVLFPKIVTLEKEEERLIRVGYQGDKNFRNEKTYRLFLEELPVTEPGETGLKLALRMAVPIFISPLKEIRKPAIEKVRFSEGKLGVKIENSGNKHFIVEKIAVMGLDRLDKEVFKTDVNGWYVLAGAKRTFVIDIPEKGCIRADKVRVTAEVQNTTMKEDLVLDKTQCVNRKEDEKALGGKSGK